SSRRSAFSNSLAKGTPATKVPDPSPSLNAALNRCATQNLYYCRAEALPSESQCASPSALKVNTGLYVIAQSAVLYKSYKRAAYSLLRVEGSRVEESLPHLSAGLP